MQVQRCFECGAETVEAEHCTLGQRRCIYPAGRGAYHLGLGLFGLEEDREVKSAQLRFTQKCLTLAGFESFVEYCIYPGALQEQEKELPARLAQR